MFGRIEPVKNGSAVCGEAPGADSGGDAVVGDLHLRQSCQEFVDALRACAAFNVESFSVSAPEPKIDGRHLEEIAYDRMEHALRELRSLRASCSAGFQAKFEALFALEDWFGREDFRVVAFAFELVEEAYAFLVVDQVADSKPAPKTNSGSSSKRQESRLSFPQLLRLAGEPKPSTQARRAVRKADDQRKASPNGGLDAFLHDDGSAVLLPGSRRSAALHAARSNRYFRR